MLNHETHEIVEIDKVSYKKKCFLIKWFSCF